MTFINWPILFALLAVSIPIIIHLFNRRKARVVDWGAMRFLSGSLVNRRRRVMIEEIALLALRCLLVAVLVLAIARPFSPVTAGISWLLLLPLLVLATTVLATATVLARNRRWRWLFYATAGGLAALAIAFSYFEDALQSERWASRGRQDVAVIIDGSSSMNLKTEGKRNFDRAVDQCRALIEKMGDSDNVSIVVAGATPQVKTSAPISVRGNINEVLDDLQPAGGTISMVDSLLAAASTLAVGDNAAKKIVVITDGQMVGWDAGQPERWKFAAGVLKNLPTNPRIVCHTIPLPPAYRNVAVAGVELSREIVGTDRPVVIRVRIENTGTEPITAEGVELRVDGETIDRAVVGEIVSGGSEQLRFTHRFESAGTRVVEIMLLSQDDLAADNMETRVVEVIDTLPVLLVDGAAAVRDDLRATSFMELALAPPAEDSDDEDGEVGPSDSQPLVRATAISAPDVNESINFDDYRVVVLADVPRLGASTCDRLAKFVSRGGGLLIAPGSRAQAEFYNQWTTPDGAPLLPAQLQQRVVLSSGQRAAQIVRETFTHGALERVAAHSKTDINNASINGFWKLDVEDSDPSAVTGAVLDSGEPLLVERTLGRGRVALTAVSLDDAGSNLPGLMSFVPLVHELTYHLATPEVLKLNYEPGNVVKLYLSRAGEKDEKQAEDDKAADEKTDEQAVVANVLTPQGETRQAAIEAQPQGLLVTLVGGTQTGLYHFQLPEPYSQQFSHIADEEKGIPVAVTANIAESRLEQISEFEENVASSHTDYFRADSADQLVAAVIGDVPGHELWQYLAAAALVILLAEIFLTRFIAIQRRTGSAEKVEFTSEGERIISFRERARELVEAARAN